MEKKLKISIILVLIVLFSVTTFKFMSSSLGNKDNNLAQNLKKLIPIEVKRFLKKNIFIIKELNNEIEFKNEIIERKENQISKILDEVILSKQIDITFKKNYEKNFTIDDELNFNLKKFKTNLLVQGKWHRAKGTSYLAIDNDKIFLASGNGYFAYTSLDFFEKSEINFKTLKSNIKDLISLQDFYKSSFYGIKGILVKDNYVYISLTNEKQKNCFNTAVFFAELNFKKLEFKEFFNPDECVKKRKIDFHPAQSGGRMIINNDKMILSIGDFRYRDLAQKKDSIFGKIIEIDLKNKSFKVLSVGHRNPQGLIVNLEKNFLINTEHGPKGGDEINLNKNYKKGVKNFGWPISSYGEHYGYEKRNDKKEIYKKFPLYKSHSKYGFIEPLKYYVPSIAISQIAELDTIDQQNFLYVIGSLGDTPEIGHMSLHFVFIDKKNLNLKKEKKISINERVRDLIYYKKEKYLIMFLETTASIGLLKLTK